jgi:hypothetical protein
MESLFLLPTVGENQKGCLVQERIQMNKIENEVIKAREIESSGAEAVALEQAKIDKTTEVRTEAFKDLFTYADNNNIDLTGDEWKRLSVWVVSEFGINQKVSDLGDLDVGPESMKEYEFKRILARARTGIKQLVEGRKKFADVKDSLDKPTGAKFGPYNTNRHLRRTMARRIIKPVKASQRSSFASRIVAANRQRRSLGI